MSSSTPNINAPVGISLPKSKYELEFNQGSVYGDEDKAAILRVFEANAPSCGSEVLSFEKEFAAFVGGDGGVGSTGNTLAVAVGNATQGLEIAVRAVLKSIEEDECCSNACSRNEVIVPSISWISTASAAALGGGVVKFADVLGSTLCIDPSSVKALVSDRTAAVIVVHLYGRPVDDLHELSAFLRERGIMLIEDCAHAVGSKYSSGQSCGTIGDIGVFSFHQQKNMVTLGEGGMCVTSNRRLHQYLVGFRSLCAKSYDPKGKYLAMDAELHPMGKKYWLMDFIDHGHNFRMLDMQAAVGRVQLKKVVQWNNRRADIARALRDGLENVHSGLVVPEVKINCSNSNSSGGGGDQYTHAWHLFHILVTDSFPLPKEDFMWELLHEYGIKTWNHYSPMHLSTSFRSKGLGHPGQCPVAESMFEQYVSLPLHPRLTDEAVQYMINSIKEIAHSKAHVARPTPNNTLIQALVSLSNPLSTKKSAKSRDDETVDAQLELFLPQVRQAVQDGLFESNVGVYISRAPGRLDLMGGNDDYTGGLVFECTISEGTYVAAAAQSSAAKSGQIIIRNRQLSKDDVTVPISLLQQPNLNPSDLAADLKARFSNSRWQLYVVGVLYYLHLHYPSKMFSNQRGLSLTIWTQVPLNRGVSSSASVEVAVMKGAAHAFGIDIGGETLATACQWVENQVCSSACGLMDQMAVTLGKPFMAMQCQPACIRTAPPIPGDLTIFALDSGVSHEISGIEYEAARAAAFMGYKIICQMQSLSITEEANAAIPRYTDSKYNGYLANMSPSVFTRCFENQLPASMSGQEFLDKYGAHVDPATTIVADYMYSIRANTKYAVMENNRVTLFYQLLKGCKGQGDVDLYIQLGDLMYQSHDSYTECGLGSGATSKIVDLVRALGPESGLFGAKITGGGAGGTVAVLGLASAKEVFQTKVVQEYARARNLTELPYVFVGSSPGADAFGVREVS